MNFRGNRRRYASNRFGRGRNTTYNYLTRSFAQQRFPRRNNNNNRPRNRRQRNNNNNAIPSNRFGFNLFDTRNYNRGRNAIISKNNELNKVKNLLRPGANNLNSNNKSVIPQVQQQQINKLANQLDKMGLFLNKEPRVMSNALQMYSTRNYYSTFLTDNKFLYYASYAQYTLNTFNSSSGTGDNGFIWFPFAYPFITDSMQIQFEGSSRRPSMYSTLMPSRTTDMTTMTYLPDTLMPYKGQYRLVATTMKISNVSIITRKSGTYTIYRLQDNVGFPKIGLENAINYSRTAGLLEYFDKNYNQTAEKAVIKPGENLVVNDWNVYQGNNQFANCDEYCGVAYQPTTTGVDLYPKGADDNSFNPVGVSVKYLVKFNDMDNQKLFIETYRVYEVIPDGSTGLQGSIHKQEIVLTPKQRTQLKNRNHFEIIPA